MNCTVEMFWTKIFRVLKLDKRNKIICPSGLLYIKSRVIIELCMSLESICCKVKLIIFPLHRCMFSQALYFNFTYGLLDLNFCIKSCGKIYLCKLTCAWSAWSVLLCNILPLHGLHGLCFYVKSNGTIYLCMVLVSRRIVSSLALPSSHSVMMVPKTVTPCIYTINNTNVQVVH